jgi:hypothetical protein
VGILPVPRVPTNSSLKGVSMKKLLVFSIIMLILTIFVCTLASAQTWYRANQATVEWEAVTQTTSDTPIPATDKIKYDVYITNAILDPDKANPVKLAEDIVELEYTITLREEGYFFVGVVAKRYGEDGEMISHSIFAWSDNILHAPEPFGVVLFLPPGAAKGLKKRE